MNGSDLACRDERRRQKVRAEELNGLDFLEVSEDQCTLTVTFLAKAPEGVGPANVRIDGGRRVRNISVTGVRLCREEDPDLDDCMLVTVDRPGDFSTYTLRLVKPDLRGRPGDEAFDGFDPRYAELAFSFKASCPSEFDCATSDDCPPEPLREPEISYLAKDYASFRQLIFDRLALIAPDWKERHVPDLGVTLVELLAYVGDYLSYYQDAVATEAYLGTARRRISVRRHVRLIDYPMHDGCNARAWVCVEASQNLVLKAGDFFFITATGDAPPVAGWALERGDLRGLRTGSYQVFEPLIEAEVTLNPAHNEIRFWTWGDQECCLPRGATRATLEDSWDETALPQDQDRSGTRASRGRSSRHHASVEAQVDKPPWGYSAPQADTSPTDEAMPPASDRPRRLGLEVGNVLILEEIIGPGTGVVQDADPTHRQAVRLTRVETQMDELYQQPIVEVEWAPNDALRFPLCLSAVAGPGGETLDPVSVARGNVILVDHGRTVGGEEIDRLEVPPATQQADPSAGVGLPRDAIVAQPVFCPVLGHGPVTQRAPLPARLGPASDSLRQDPCAAQPVILLGPEPPINQVGAPTLSADEAAGKEPGQRGDAPRTGPLTAAAGEPELAWTARRDLLGSQAEDRHFVAEVDDEGLTHLRFGDGELGGAPAPGTTLLANYRVGNGTVGNVAAEVISRIVLGTADPDRISRVRNPLPAEGGVDPEPLAEVRLFAPTSFRRTLGRAITADDYASLAGQVSGVQRAAANLCWTGSWHEVVVAIDPLGGVEADERLLATVQALLERYRRIGHGLLVRPARYVPLDIALRVCVLPRYLRAHVELALLNAFSNRVLPGGRFGYFHPDRLTFGDDLPLSKLMATAQAVPGVESVTITRLERLHEGDNGELERGLLALGPLEIARLDNDRSFPENGQLKLELRGGR